VFAISGLSGVTLFGDDCVTLEGFPEGIRGGAFLFLSSFTNTLPALLALFGLGLAFNLIFNPPFFSLFTLDAVPFPFGAAAP